MQGRNTNTDKIISLLAAEEKTEAADLKAELENLLFDKNELRFQHRLAPLLRSMAIKHLRTGNTNYAVEFRNSFLTLDNQEALDAFLNTQARNGEWGKEIEAGALADLFDLTMMITPVTWGIKQSHFIAQKAQDESRPIIHLYNSNNVHWYIYEGLPHLTDGDNNCLYNGFAQGLRQIIVAEKSAKELESSPLDNQPAEYEDICKQQADLLAAIQNLLPISMDELIKRIKEPIKPAEEKDMQYALASAYEDLHKTKSSGKIISGNSAAAMKLAFEAQMKLIKSETSSLAEKAETNPNYLKAAQAAKTLLECLQTGSAAYFKDQNQKTYGKFKTDSLTAIENSRKELEKRGWAAILANLGFFILGLGVGYLIAGAINYKRNGRFYFYPTEAAKKLDQLQTSLEQWPQPAALTA